MSYYYIKGYDIEAEDESKAIENYEKRLVAIREMRHRNRLLEGNETDNLMCPIEYSDYHRTIASAYIQYMNLDINVNNLSVRGNKFIDFTGKEDTNKVVYNEFIVENTDAFKKYLKEYILCN